MNERPTPRKINHRCFLRSPIKTKILTPNDDIISIVCEYTNGLRKENDIIVISESPVAITQNRAINEEGIKVGFMAKFLWRGVKNVEYGVGLRSQTSMQCAIDECGHLRILFAAVFGLCGKLIGKRGIFYKVAGNQAALIDAAHTSPVPPYDKTVIKGPVKTNQICKKIKQLTGNETAIMDINDIGGSWVMGKSDGVDEKLLEQVMNDNPQGQQKELTPICLVWEKND